MNLLCYNYLNHAGIITDEQEESLVDYMDSIGIDIDIDMDLKTICKKLLNLEPYNPTVYKETITSEVPNYGYLNIDLYMKIAMETESVHLELMTIVPQPDAKKLDRTPINVCRDRPPQQD